METVSKSKVLITGVAGFIGSHVAERFLSEGYEVIGVDDLSSGRLENVPKGVFFIQGDLALTETIDLIPKGCLKILHLAGQSSGEISFDDPVSDLNKNTVSTLNIIQYAIQNNSERIVYASSMSVYGNAGDGPVDEAMNIGPLSCYGVSKAAAEYYLEVYKNEVPYVILRMFNVYGPGQDMSNMRQGMVSIYLAQALSIGSILVKGSLDRFRDFIYIEDVVDCWYRATLSDKVLQKKINIATGVKTTIRDLLGMIKALLPNSSFDEAEGTPGDQTGIYAETSAMASCLDKKSFVPLRSGLLSFITWENSKQNLN